MSESDESGRCFTPDECLKYAEETKALVIKYGALESIPGLLAELYDFETVCLVTDENTLKAAGLETKKVLENAGIKISGSYTFPGTPTLHAESRHLHSLAEWLSSLPGFPALVPIAVGGGAINDLVKKASSELKLQYLCVPTAASVDGYTANGASLLMDGFKQTLPCGAPRAIAADIGVISRAPAYLASSGFGDLAGKITAGTDWIIADLAGTVGAREAPAIDMTAWGMVQNGLMDALNRSIDAARGDGDAAAALFSSLAVTGFAMQYMKNPRPVSGAEHLWSHVWEMEDDPNDAGGKPGATAIATHGHKVAIGTLAATAFTEQFFADPKGPPDAEKGYRRPSREERKAEVYRSFSNSRVFDKVVLEAMKKYQDEKTVREINQAFRDSWAQIRDRVLKKLLPYGELKSLLARAGCPVTPESIGFSRKDAILTARRAQLIRNKYSILDLSWDMGNIEKILKNIEISEIYLR